MHDKFVNRQWIYGTPIVERLTRENFERRDAPVPALRQGQALIRNRLISIDPANRLYFAMQAYRPQIEVGDVMAAFAIGEVVRSTDPRFRVGDLWHGDFGWQDYAILNSYDRAEYFHRCTPGRAEEDLLGVFGVTGMTAYFGVEKVGRLRPGETAVVAGATGACGVLIGQLARIAGARTIGFAGGPERCRWLVEKIGFDEVVDYTARDFAARLADLCPNGVDFYSDAVGGSVSQATLALMKPGGRWYHYGSLIDYQQLKPGESLPRHDAFMPPELKALCAERGIRPQFLLVFDEYCGRLTAESILDGYMREGRLQAPSTVVEGFDKLPQMLVDGAGLTRYGKLSVRIA